MNTASTGGAIYLTTCPSVYIILTTFDSNYIDITTTESNLTTAWCAFSNTAYSSIYVYRADYYDDTSTFSATSIENVEDTD